MNMFGKSYYNLGDHKKQFWWLGTPKYMLTLSSLVVLMKEKSYNNLNKSEIWDRLFLLPYLLYEIVF